jgi:RNA polymerase sigma factor (sigma-70 family)
MTEHGTGGLEESMDVRPERDVEDAGVSSRPGLVSDDDLVARAQRGSAAAFEALYDRHAANVARALASFAGPDRDLLDDLTQDVFLRVVGGLATYTPSRPFAHWLYTIALNVGRNHVRRASRIVPMNPAELESMRDTGSPAADGSEAIATTTLMRLVATLPLALREVVSLRVGSDMSYREIGGLLGIPEGTARRRMHNALQQLREQSGSIEPRRSQTHE